MGAQTDGRTDRLTENPQAQCVQCCSHSGTDIKTNNNKQIFYQIRTKAECRTYVSAGENELHGLKDVAVLNTFTQQLYMHAPHARYINNSELCVSTSHATNCNVTVLNQQKYTALLEDLHVLYVSAENVQNESPDTSNSFVKSKQ